MNFFNKKRSLEHWGKKIVTIIQTHQTVINNTFNLIITFNNTLIVFPPVGAYCNIFYSI